MNIYDIATRANCSIATVSRVLNNNPGVGSTVRKRVLQVISEENYVPNACARGLGRGSNDMVGILCANVMNPFSAQAVSSFEQKMRKNGYASLLCSAGTDLADKHNYLDYLLSKQVLAIALIGSSFADPAFYTFIEQAASKVPIVLLNGQVSSKNVYCICSDEYDANARNVQLLHEYGCKRILYLHDSLTLSGTKKLSGYQYGLGQCGLPMDDALVLSCSRDIAAVHACIRALIERETDFDALIASEDYLAAAAQGALMNAGIRVPVISFNNDILSQLAYPAITSVDLMLDSMCDAAVNVLVNVLANKSSFGPATIILPSKLIMRDSFRL